METIASAAILIAATLLAFAFALFLHWAFLSLLFRFLPGKARAHRPRVLVHTASPFHLAR